MVISVSKETNLSMELREALESFADEWIPSNLKILNYNPDIKGTHRSINLVYLAISGSHIYGTYTSESDYDMKGIFILPTDNILRLENSVKQFNSRKKNKTKNIRN
jgi:hypothetical protein